MLKLRVGLDCEVVGEVVVETDARGVDEGVAADVTDVAEDEAGVEVVDFAAAEEEVGVGVEAFPGIFDFGAEEEVFLAADVALVDGIGAANLKGGRKLAKGEKGEVGAGGDAQIFAALEVGEGASACDKGGELELLGSGRGGLRGCDVVTVQMAANRASLTSVCVNFIRSSNFSF